MEKLKLAMASLLGLSDEEIEKAIPVKEQTVLCKCRFDKAIKYGLYDLNIVAKQTKVELQKVGDKDGIIGAVGRCANCGKVYYCIF